MNWRHASSIYDFTLTPLLKKPIPLSTFKNKPLLLVNVASKCGTASTNYDHLISIHKQYPNLEILLQPCNQFGKQEPLQNEELFNHIQKKFNTPESFHIFEKRDVLGDSGLDLWLYLQKHWRTLDYNNPSFSIPGVVGMNTIRWNFTKFLIDGEGKPRVRYGPKELVKNKDIEMILNN